MQAVRSRVAGLTKGELTRQRIIREAAALFNQRGFAGCSVQDVMEAAALEKGGIYRHFESKEALAAAAFEYAYGETVKLRRQGMEEISSAVGRLRHMVEQFVEVPSAVPGGCPLLNTAIDADDGNAVLRNLAAGALRDWKKRIVRIARKGVRSGELTDGVPPETLANVMIATLEGALMICRLEGNRRALRDAGVALNSMLDGCETKSAGA